MRILFTDFHSHVLLFMYGGYEDEQMSVQMLSMLKRQGADNAVAVSHYYAFKER